MYEFALGDIRLLVSFVILSTVHNFRYALWDINCIQCDCGNNVSCFVSWTWTRVSRWLILILFQTGLILHIIAIFCIGVSLSILVAESIKVTVLYPSFLLT